MKVIADAQAVILHCDKIINRICYLSDSAYRLERLEKLKTTCLFGEINQQSKMIVLDWDDYQILDSEPPLPYLDTVREKWEAKYNLDTFVPMLYSGFKDNIVPLRNVSE